MKNVLLNPCSESGTKKMGRFGTLVSRSNQAFRLLTLIGIFCLAAFTNVSAQQVTVKGQVKDAAGAGLPGVGVKVKDAATLTSTDATGNFSISVPATGTLVFSYVGFAQQEVAVGGRTTITVTLEESTQNLDEVVVTALGVTKSRRSLVSSVQEVKGDEFTGARENNIANALTGKIAGLDAAQVNSGPGASSKVTIRGANSLQSGGNNQPLYVVDGVPIRNSNQGANVGSQSFNVDRGDGISMINPDDIETISVLKGGSAAALYGSQAANGVILITTKSGKAGKGVGVELNSVGTVRTPSIYPNYQYVYGQGGAPNAGAWTVPTTLALAQASGRLSFGPKMDPNISYIQVDGKMHPLTPQYVKDNINNFYEKASDLTNNVAFSGGNENFTTRLSITDLRSNAQQPNSTYTRQGGTLNTSAKLGKNNWLQVSGGLNYTMVNGKNRPNVGYAEYSADWPVYLIANTVDIRSLSPGITSTGNELAWNLAQEAPNPYFVVNYMGNSDKSQRFIMNADIRMNVVKNLSVRVWGNRDYQLNDNYNYTPLLKNSQPLGSYGSNFENNWATQVYASVDYNTTFLKDFGAFVSVGGNNTRGRSLGSTLNGTNWIVPGFYSVSNLGIITTTGATTSNGASAGAGGLRDETRSGTNSAFGQLDLDYKKIVYLNVTGRNDWFSQLNRGSNSIFYPSVGTSVIVSDIVKMPTQINMLKVRGSWARVGLATVNSSAVRQSYSINTANNYGVPTLGISSSLIDPTLRPLTVDTWEGGFETQLLGSRLSLDATYYNKTTKDDLLPVTITPASGYGGGTANAGSIRNQGIELMLSGNPVRTANFSWNANINFTFNKSRILKLSDQVSEVSLGSGIGGPRTVNRVGLPYGTVFGSVESRDANGNVIYNATNNQSVVGEVALGTAYPPFLYGFNNDFRFKQFSLNVFFDAKFGGVAFSNFEQYATRFGLLESTLPGRENGLTVNGVTTTGAAYTYTYPIGNSLYSNVYNRANAKGGQFVHSTDFIKLRRVTLSYNIPVSKLKAVKLKGASISLVGSNLLRLFYSDGFKAIGQDPENQESISNAQGLSGVAAPITRSFGANLRVSF